MDRKFFKLVVFTDLIKAFDTIDHDILQEKLLLLGIKGSAFQLLKSYLHDRLQKCEVNGVILNESNVKCDLPQVQFLDHFPFCFI